MGYLHGLYLAKEEEIFLDRYGLVVRKHSVENRKIDFHWHDYFELELVCAGEGLHMINGKTIELRAGSAFLLSPTDLHAVSGGEGFCLINICFLSTLLPEQITDYLLANDSPQCTLSLEELSRFEKQIQSMTQISDEFPFKKELIANIFSEIVLRMIEKTAAGKNRKPSSLTQKTVCYMMRNFKKDLTLARVSEEFSVTPKYLGAVFRENTGVSFHEYLNNLRLKFACGLLRSSDLSVKEAAFASGYHSVEHFLYVFRKKMHTTPTAFRA